MPTLEWIGKDKVVNHHQEVPYRVLERQYSYDEAGQHVKDNGSENMVIHGDNLEALKALLPRYEGKVKCIYIDPPYNTGNEGWVYNDNVNDPKIKKWLGIPNLKAYENYIMEWHAFLNQCENALETLSEENVRILEMYVLRRFYETAYMAADENGFYEEFSSRLGEVREKFGF